MIFFWGAKGGSGVTVTAAAVAVTASRTRPCRLVDLGGDQPAALGLHREPDDGVAQWLAAGPGVGVEALHRLAVEVRDGLMLLGRGAGPLDADGGDRLVAALDSPEALSVVDAGPTPHARTELATRLASAASAGFLVTRPCFLALRRAVDHPLLSHTSGVVLVTEPRRALAAADVGRVLGRPVVARVRAEASVARAVDAGVLAARVPEAFERPARRLLAEAGMGAGPPPERPV